MIAFAAYYDAFAFAYYVFDAFAFAYYDSTHSHTLSFTHEDEDEFTRISVRRAAHEERPTRTAFFLNK